MTCAQTAPCWGESGEVHYWTSFPVRGRSPIMDFPNLKTSDIGRSEASMGFERDARSARLIPLNSQSARTKRSGRPSAATPFG